MSDDARIELLRAGVDAFNRGDAEPALAIFADDVECHVAADLDGHRHVPGSRRLS